MAQAARLSRIVTNPEKTQQLNIPNDFVATRRIFWYVPINLADKAVRRQDAVLAHAARLSRIVTNPEKIQQLNIPNDFVATRRDFWYLPTLMADKAERRQDALSAQAARLGSTGTKPEKTRQINIPNGFVATRREY